MNKAFINGKIILEDRVLEDKIIIFNENIISIEDSLEDLIEDSIEVIDLKGKYLSPGFIDIHIHGSNGSDTMDGNEEAISIISKNVVKYGVTSFLATTMTQSKEKITKSLKAISSYKSRNDLSGAKVIGVHLEGPFISEAYKGAQSSKFIIGPDMELVNDYLDLIKLMTVAPEVDGIIRFIEKIHDINFDMKFSIGHSSATYEEAIKGYENGITSTTHLFNGMTGLHHRNPGVIGAVFTKKPYFEVIADNIHLHTSLYKTMGDAIGIDKMILVTDAISACGMHSGNYELGGQKVVVDGVSVRLINGTLAGSILKMNDAIRNVLSNTDYSISQVVNMASLNPALMIGEKNIGKISEGNKADFVIFDENLDIYMTVIEGNIIFRKDT